MNLLSLENLGVRVNYLIIIIIHVPIVRFTSFALAVSLTKVWTDKYMNGLFPYQKTAQKYRTTVAGSGRWYTYIKIAYCPQPALINVPLKWTPEIVTTQATGSTLQRKPWRSVLIIIKHFKTNEIQ
jgi:hypothetical protein